MATWRLPLLRRTLPLLSPPPSPLSYLSSFSAPLTLRRSNSKSVQCSLSVEESTSAHSQIPQTRRNSNWKPMCLYHAQGQCTKTDEPLHLEKFCHSWSVNLGEGVPGPNNLREQEFDYFLVLDLEGKVEILEFPVLLFDAKTMDVVDVFHRFVRPTKMSEERINEYIEGKYGAFGVDRVWHDTAIKFDEVIEQFEEWLRKGRNGHMKLRREDGDGPLNEAAFVTCGNWDLKTKIPQQCEVSGMKVPPYFMEWINLKDIYLNFYNRRPVGYGLKDYQGPTPRKTINSIVVVGLYYGFLTIFSIGPSYFFFLQAQVMKEGTEKKVSTTTGFIRGQLMIFISIYYVPPHLALVDLIQ